MRIREWTSRVAEESFIFLAIKRFGITGIEKVRGAGRMLAIGE